MNKKFLIFMGLYFLPSACFCCDKSSFDIYTTLIKTIENPANDNLIFNSVINNKTFNVNRLAYIEKRTLKKHIFSSFTKMFSTLGYIITAVEVLNDNDEKFKNLAETLIAHKKFDVNQIAFKHEEYNKSKSFTLLAYIIYTIENLDKNHEPKKKALENLANTLITNEKFNVNQIAYTESTKYSNSSKSITLLAYIIDTIENLNNKDNNLKPKETFLFNLATTLIKNEKFNDNQIAFSYKKSSSKPKEFTLSTYITDTIKNLNKNDKNFESKKNTLKNLAQTLTTNETFNIKKAKKNHTQTKIKNLNNKNNNFKPNNTKPIVPEPWYKKPFIWSGALTCGILFTHHFLKNHNSTRDNKKMVPKSNMAIFKQYSIPIISTASAVICSKILRSSYNAYNLKNKENYKREPRLTMKKFIANVATGLCFGLASNYILQQIHLRHTI